MASGRSVCDARAASPVCRGEHPLIFLPPSSLDRNVPFPARPAYRDIAHHAQRVPTVTVTQPAELRQKYPSVVPIELALFRVGLAEAIAPAFPVRALQVFEQMLQRIRRSILKPGHFFPVTFSFP